MHGFACRNSVHLISRWGLLLALTSFGVFAVLSVLAIAAPPRSRPGLPLSPIWGRFDGPGERSLDAADSRNGGSPRVTDLYSYRRRPRRRPSGGREA